MALTVGELMREAGLDAAAGRSGLGAPVRWVHISELLDPTPWLSGGELLLTTGLQLEHPAEQHAYVEGLARHGLAGLGLGTGFGHARLPEAMLDAADELGFPLFEVPYALPFIAITEQAFAHLVNEQYAVMQRALSAHERLERVVLEERGLEGIAATLCSVIGAAAFVLDAHGEVLARCGGDALPGELVDALGAQVRARSGADAERGFHPAGDGLDGRALAVPVARGRSAEPQAWLVAVKDDGRLDEFDRLVLRQAVTVVALELLRGRVAADTERRLAGDVLTAMVSGELSGPDLSRRLEPFGLAGRVGVLVLAPEGGARSAVESALASAVREEAAAGLVAAAGRFSCALLSQPRGEEPDEALFALAERIRARVSRETGQTLTGGAGRAVGAGEVRRSFHEARCALEARTLAEGADAAPAVLATYQDLGSFQLLLSLQDDEALRLFCDSVLAPIEEGEGAYGGELMRSLETFIECNGQWERAAKQLFCHRHTLRYRIRRVEELTGRSLDSARDRIDFWLALRGRELVSH
jgi:purine catabolism regulator